MTLDDEDIIAKCRSSKSGAKFERLWSGDDSEHGNDRSRGDQAFTSLLSFYTQDPDQILRIVQQSGRWRDKWKRRDYQQRTVTKALQRSDFYTPPRASEIRMVPPITQDDPSDADPCTAERDTIATLRAEVAALRAENAALSRLQSATMALLRSRELQAGEKIVGLVSLFEAEAATRRGTTDPDGWTDTPLERIAESAGCSAKVAGKHHGDRRTTG